MGNFNLKGYLLAFLSSIGFLSLVQFTVIGLFSLNVNLGIVMFLTVIISLVFSFRYMNIRVEVNNMDSSTLENLLNENKWKVKSLKENFYLVENPFIDKILCTPLEIFIEGDKIVVDGSNCYVKEISGILNTH